MESKGPRVTFKNPNVYISAEELEEEDVYVNATVCPMNTMPATSVTSVITAKLSDQIKEADQHCKYVTNIFAFTNANLKTNITNLNGENNMLRAENQLLRNKKHSLTSGNQDLMAENQRLTSGNQGLMAEKQHLIAENQRLTSGNQGLTAEKQHLIAENQRLTSGNQGLTAEKQHLIAENQRLTSGNQGLTAEKQHLIAENQRLTSGNQGLTAEKQHLIAENQRLTSGNQGLTAEKQHLIAEKQRLTSGNQGLTAEKQHLIAEKQRLTSRNQGLMAENQRLTAENQYLRAKNQLTTDITTTQYPEWYTQWPTVQRYRTRQAHPTIDRWTEPFFTTYPFRYRKKRQSEPCQTGWLYFQSSCYAISHRDPPDQRTWEEARDDCREKNADLVVIESPEEQGFISNSSLASLAGDDFWIGLRVDGDGWKWVSGYHLTEDYWMHQPADNHHCVISVQETKGWKAVECEVKNRWICEMGATSL
uniref:CD209 antigen-like isoform X2 n=1 Tax=Semicossyphus pulcher TaxID=241346 RepID=UPI0037E7B7FA